MLIILDVTGSQFIPFSSFVTVKKMPVLGVYLSKINHDVHIKKDYRV